MTTDGTWMDQLGSGAFPWSGQTWSMSGTMVYTHCGWTLTPVDPFNCVWFFVTLWTYSPLGSTVYGILQARIWEWLACPPPGDLSHPGIEPASHFSCIGRQVLYNLCYLGSPGRSWKTLQKEPTTWSKFPSILLIGLTEAGLSSRVSLSRDQHFSYKTSSTSLQETSNPGIRAGGDVGTFLIVVFLQMEPALYTSSVIYYSLFLPVREFYIPIICPVTCSVFLEKELLVSKLWTYDLLYPMEP